MRADVQSASQIGLGNDLANNRPCRYPITIPSLGVSDDEQHPSNIFYNFSPTRRRRNESQIICKIAPQCRSLRKKMMMYRSAYWNKMLITIQKGLGLSCACSMSRVTYKANEMF